MAMLSTNAGLGEAPNWDRVTDTLVYTAGPEDIALLNAQVNALDAQAALDTGSGRPVTAGPLGPVLPSGFENKPFDCPVGSEYYASQQVGMCVAADFSPVYSQATPGGPKTYYNLDGSIAGAEPGAGTGCPAGTIIPCLKNTYFYLGVGFLVLVLMKGRR